MMALSSAEMNGLNAAIVAARMQGSRMYIRYELRVLQENPPWDICKPYTIVQIRFYNDAGTVIGTPTMASIVLTGPFADGLTDTCECELVTDVPHTAQTFTIELANTGLMTRPIPVPR
jgi:hypothetical protein